MKSASRYIFGFLGGILLFAIVTNWGPVVLRPWRTEQPPAAQTPAPQTPAPQTPAPQTPAPQANPQFAPPQFPTDIFKLVQEKLTAPGTFPMGTPPANLPPGGDGADPINRAISQLSGDWGNQDTACKTLIARKPDDTRRAEVVAALEKMIDARVRFSPRPQAVRALAVWGTAAEVPYLLRLLDDSDTTVQEAAIVALGKMKDARAADVLALRLNSNQRAIAGDALREIGPAAEKIVREQLKSAKESASRIEAIKVLKVIGTTASQKDLFELVTDPDPGVALAAREALPPNLRPPLWGPRQTVTLNVHVCDYNAWPAIEAKIKALADSPTPTCKSDRSGDYMWVTLSPVSGDLDKFARRIDFGKIGSIHTDKRLIYVESGK